MVACRMVQTFDSHQAVLLAEALSALAVKPDGIYIDATFGRGGHSQAILDHLGPQGKLYAFDKDPDAVRFARVRFSHDSRFSIFHASFAKLTSTLISAEISGKVDGILFDLGVSSPQLDNPDRGFSFMRAGTLDMRMNTAEGKNAAQWLNEVSEQDLAEVLWKWGDERFSRRIARAIVEARAESPITTTQQLAEIIANAVLFREKGKHPATRSFQAIRIAINHELDELQQGLAAGLEMLRPGGRLVVISFHSLEDRMVKQFIHQHEQGKELPHRLPIKGKHFHAQLKKLGRALKPCQQEIDQNPRARSAILRLAEKQL
jgi:16S rRNA (cytosine1402-N4)-methyltransferase